MTVGAIILIGFYISYLPHSPALQVEAEDLMVWLAPRPVATAFWATSGRKKSRWKRASAISKPEALARYSGSTKLEEPRG